MAPSLERANSGDALRSFFSSHWGVFPLQHAPKMQNCGIDQDASVPAEQMGPPKSGYVSDSGKTTDVVSVIDLKLEKMVSTLSAKAVSFQLPCTTSSRRRAAPAKDEVVDADIESAGYVGDHFTDTALGECLLNVSHPLFSTFGSVVLRCS